MPVWIGKFRKKRKCIETVNINSYGKSITCLYFLGVREIEQHSQMVSMFGLIYSIGC